MIKLTGAIAAVAVLAAAGAADAATVTWNAWDPSSISNGTIAGTMGAVTVTYTGEIGQFQQDYPSWSPSTSYVGGSVGNAPVPSDGIFHLVGGGTNTDTITFSEAVIDPVIAIWSLGQGGDAASFVFSAPFTIQAGGPSAEYGGASITQPFTNTASGMEGNGTIQFQGTFTSLSFTTPQAENWYGFAVGVEGVAGVPEPASWALMILGFGGAGAVLRRRRRVGFATA
jgi:hypothetical protein